MEMDERKLRILQAIIDDYITTAVPVGSRTISKKYGIGGLSSATIRNEMSDLEELGYLDQPHTSAGRVPSLKAYRLYVEKLLHGTPKLPQDAVEQLLHHFDNRTRQVEDVIRSAAQAISDVTRYTAVVTAPQAEAPRVRHIQFVPVSEGVALMVLVTDAGIVRDNVIRVDALLTAEDLFEIGRMLTAELQGLTVEESRARLAELSTRYSEHRAMFEDVVDVVDRAETKEVMVGGRSNILHYPEYSDAEKARAVLSVLDKREKIMQLMRSAPQMVFTIRIGEETGMPETSNCSVVTMNYRIGNETTGTIGVIGPTRMDYARVIPVLDYMGRALGKLMGVRGRPGAGKSE
ncbi:MAG TPA: heat-inducible transcription repressor HrcA [Candidatus Aphodomonas merdavium]|nr:heat-inducible transcription repressor HrcA [Candidatus Aphodomonas merdavium]